MDLLLGPPRGLGHRVHISSIIAASDSKVHERYDFSLKCWVHVFGAVKFTLFLLRPKQNLRHLLSRPQNGTLILGIAHVTVFGSFLVGNMTSRPHTLYPSRARMTVSYFCRHSPCNMLDCPVSSAVAYLLIAMLVPTCWHGCKAQTPLQQQMKMLNPLPCKKILSFESLHLSPSPGTPQARDAPGIPTDVVEPEPATKR